MIDARGKTGSKRDSARFRKPLKKPKKEDVDCQGTLLLYRVTSIKSTIQLNLKLTSGRNNAVNLRTGGPFVGAASSRDSSFSENLFRGWKPLPLENDVKLIALAIRLKVMSWWACVHRIRAPIPR